MKDPLKINELQTLPLVVQEKLLEEIRSENIDLIFSSSPPFSPIPQITVVLNKDINNNSKDELQESSWSEEVFETFNIIVTFCNHIVFPFHSDFHFAYTSLYLHPRFIIYKRKESTWKSLFQNHYSFSIRKQHLQLDNWICKTIQKHENYLIYFINPLIAQKQFHAAGILYIQIIRFYLHTIKILIFPTSALIFNSDGEILKNIETYYPELGKILINKDIDREYLFESLESNFIDQDIIDESDLVKIQNTTNSIKDQFKKGINNYFTPRIDYLISDLNEQQIFSKREYETFILNTIIKKLVNSYGIDLIYLIESKTSNDSIEFFLLIIGSAIKIQMEESMTSLIRNNFNQKVEVTCILHKTTWTRRHATKFLPFIYKNITDDKLVYGRHKKAHSKFIQPVLELPEDIDTTNWQKDFWLICQENVESHWLQMGLFTLSSYQVSHITQLQSIFKQLCLSYLYKKLNYVPHFGSPRYLWKLVKWADPNFSNELIQVDQAESFFSFLNTKQPFFPRQPTPINTPEQQHYHSALQICNRFYNHIKELYTY